MYIYFSFSETSLYNCILWFSFYFVNFNFVITQKRKVERKNEKQIILNLNGLNGLSAMRSACEHVNN